MTNEKLINIFDNSKKSFLCKRSNESKKKISKSFSDGNNNEGFEGIMLNWKIFLFCSKTVSALRYLKSEIPRIGK